MIWRIGISHFLYEPKLRLTMPLMRISQSLRCNSSRTSNHGNHAKLMTFSVSGGG